MILFKILYESVAQAVSQLRANRLRSFLSLLGITIGIFCIIGVQSAVDSLEDNIRGSIEKLGDDVLYIQQMPWNEDPGQNWWKYQRRPNPSMADLNVIKEKVPSAGLVDLHIGLGSKTLKYRSSSVDRVFAVAVTYDFQQLFNVEFGKGRYFTPNEYYYGKDKVIIGHKVAQELFGPIEPIGKKIKLSGRKMEVIGVIKESGRDILQILNYDELIVVGYNTAAKFANVNPKTIGWSTVNVKAADGFTLGQLKDDITGVLRASRRLQPKEDDDFALNNVSLLASIMDNIFGVMNSAALFIGGFAIFVGMFSVANIMFVSVKERTNIIGVKKALGAKQYFILLEFLIESVILCIIGGIIGLGLVYLTLYLLGAVLPFEVYLSLNNIIWGVTLSLIIGVLSGLIPAFQAARMDPVVAIRA